MEKNRDGVITGLWLAAEGTLYLWFLGLDWFGRPSAAIKYAAICLCLVMAAYQGVRTRKWLTPAAMGFTLLADTFLLLRGDHYAGGVLAFCVVQTLYAIRLARWRGWGSVWLRLGLFGAVIIGLWQLQLLDLVTGAAAWSFTQLTVSCVQALEIRSKTGPQRQLALGLLLFWGCDVCVGLHNILTYVPSFPLTDLIQAATYSMWLFYLPAQILIVRSAAPERPVRIKSMA